MCFPFGHELSYTNLTIANLAVNVLEDDDRLAITVMVQNIGNRGGTHTVQVYVSQDNPSIKSPVKDPKGYSKISLVPGERKEVEIVLSLKYAASFWDELKHA